MYPSGLHDTAAIDFYFTYHVQVVKNALFQRFLVKVSNYSLTTLTMAKIINFDYLLALECLDELECSLEIPNRQDSRTTKVFLI